MVTVVIPLTAGSTWAVPSNWNSANNTIECIGAGGNGSNAATVAGAGGGGGAYALENNVTLTPGSTVNIQIGTAGGGPGSTGDTYLKDNSSTTVVLARGGSNASSGSGGAGGDTTNSIGDTKYAGGDGGSSGASLYGGGGGGGAAGFYGAGKAGAGGGATVLTTLTLVTTDGTNIPSNAPFEFGVPIAPDALSSGQKLQVLDASSNVIGVQEDNRRTDVNGDIRMVKITGVLPTSPGTPTTTITLQTIAGTPDTSNPITLANLLAQTISADTFECKVTCTFPDGTVYTALATDALNGSSSWTYGDPQNRGKFREGPYCTEWIVSAPLETGGTPHAFLNAKFHISAYKASSAAWHNTNNPITGVKCLVILENGYIDQTGGADLVYDLLIEMGASTLSDWLSLTGSTPAATLTLGAVSGQTTASLSAGTWGAASTTAPNSQDIGKAIVEVGGSGRGYLMGLNSSTSSAVCIPTATAFASTSKTSTNWRTMGVYHPYMMRFDTYGSGHGYTLMTPWWGVVQKTVAALPTSYIIDSEMVMNYGADATSAGNPDLTYCNNDGAHPMAVHYPTTASIKNFGMDEASTGDTDHIGVLSQSFTAALLNFTYSGGQHLNARQLVFQNSRVGNMKPFCTRDSTTGGVVSIDKAGTYYWSTQNNGGVGLPANDYTGGTGWYTFATNHSGGASYLPYLLSGDFMHLETAAFAGNDYSLRTSGSGVFAQTSVTLSGGSASITIGSGYPQQDGEAVVVQIGGYFPQISGVNISRANTYYVKQIDATHINLYDTRANALAGGATGKITFSSAGTNISIRNGYGKCSLPVGVSGQPRCMAWNTRTIAQQLMPWPDSIGDLVDYSRTTGGGAGLKRQWDAMGLYAKTTWVDDVNYVADGPRITVYQSGPPTGGKVWSPWQHNYWKLANINAYEGGVMGSDWVSFSDWMLADSCQWAVNSSNEQTYFMVGAYYVRAQTTGGVNQYTYAGIAQESMKAAINTVAYGEWTQTSQTATISSVADQANVTIVLSQTFFDTVNPSRHVGSWIVVGSGCGQITSVSDGVTCVADATVSTWDGQASNNANFATGAGQSCNMPWPSWGNQASIVGTTQNYGNQADRHYLWLANSGIEIAYQRGIDTSNYATASAFMTTKALPSNPPTAGQVTTCATALKGNVVHR